MQLSMRGREGHRIAAELAGAGATSSRALADLVMRKTLEARAWSADRFKTALLGGACGKDQVDLATEEPVAKPHPVDVRQACEVLRRWPGRAGADDRGALLWDAFWTRVQKIPAKDLYAQPFSASAPLQTPSQIRTADPRVAFALAGAVEDMARKGWPLDAALGDHRFARSEGKKVRLFGGCDAEGYFTVACANEGDYTMGSNSHGNTYLQVVYFDRHGVQARTLLAHGERETAVSDGRGAGPVARYARKDWLRFPFREEDIAHDPQLRRVIVRP